MLRRLDLEQRVGQMLMVGVDPDATSPRTLRPLREAHVGNVFLAGRTRSGVPATARAVRTIRAALVGDGTGQVPLLVSVDQEGGHVQSMRGPGFDELPAAVEQGRWPASDLQERARRWGNELHSAGVNLDLAPVADVVPAALGRRNAPIGWYQRQYGSTPESVRSAASSFVRGMAASGTATTVKHFPGLGHVRGNTDDTADVEDTSVGSTDAGLRVFTDVAALGPSAVMMSTAVYRRLDPDLPAAFSREVVQGLLRGTLGFEGVVVSDDLGRARQVQSWTRGERARRFVAAGGDLVLTVEPSDAEPMATALVERARRSPAFAKRVEDSARRVLRLKAQLGLLTD